MLSASCDDNWQCSRDTVGQSYLPVDMGMEWVNFDTKFSHMFVGIWIKLGSATIESSENGMFVS